MATNRFGYNRTVASCLAILAGEDSILKEGAARDLGRLTKIDDVSGVVTKLGTLLDGTDEASKRGAIEGLGLIGTQGCYNLLQQALTKETNGITKQFIEEALSLCGSYVLVGDPSAPKLSDEEAAKLVLGASQLENTKGTNRKGAMQSSWMVDMLLERIKARETDAFKVLLAKAESSQQMVSRVAKILDANLKEGGSGSF
ncbi:MAG TPA: HEAT repeat domain-containing protein [Terriglobales bacterium]|nr:HEAT repeat domain-containing protein [Terriglobales bacterium]